MNYRVIDLQNDPRGAHFDYFRAMANPYVGTTVMVDVTGLLKGCRESGRPFFLSFLYCAGRAANAVPELRRRIVGDEVRQYERCDTSHTVLRPDGSYGFCRVNCMMPFEAYLKETAERHERAKREPEGYAEDETDLLFVSCLPWVRYVSLELPTSVPADSNPRITWGKYAQEGERVTMPVSLLANHALVVGRADGQLLAPAKRILRP